MKRMWLLLVVGVVLVCGGLVYAPSTIVGVVVVALAGTLLLFFRDPERDVPHIPDVLLSAADGTVLAAQEGMVSVFMSVWDVHVNRSPCDGRVVSMHRRGGSHLPAFLSSSKKNSRLSIELATEHGEVRVVLISGMIARRIVPFVREGEDVQQGERIGRIVLGSRVDVLFDKRWRVCTSRGARVRAGITPIAVLEDAAHLIPSET